ncbi:MAG: hypothetical protein J07HQW2_00517 [Haloquadratum walsbyi J07HQW2]|uniref:Uncharacterized protein n=1 Tax=Haloquadratum walsbyi J07HQW2 TaxID=1238425 RepID=U1NBQ0_9EURY|nr:MAG: hypothetical protein J07HQW2_00517 [Haloquadratum walsbyi J07HQW2]
MQKKISMIDSQYTSIERYIREVIEKMSIEEDRERGLITDISNTSIEGCPETTGNYSSGRRRRNVQRLPL